MIDWNNRPLNFPKFSGWHLSILSAMAECHVLSAAATSAFLGSQKRSALCKLERFLINMLACRITWWMRSLMLTLCPT